MELTVHNTNMSDNVEKRGKSAGEAENRNVCRTKFPLMRDLLYGNVQLLNTILESLSRNVTKLL